MMSELDLAQRPLVHVVDEAAHRFLDGHERVGLDAPDRLPDVLVEVGERLGRPRRADADLLLDLGLEAVDGTFAWLSWPTYTMVGGALVLLALAVVVERRAAEPVVPLDIVRAAYGDATGHIFLISAAIAVVGLVAAIFLPRTALRTSLDLPARDREPVDLEG